MSHFDATWQPWHSHVPTSHILPTSSAFRKTSVTLKYVNPTLKSELTELMKSVYRLRFFYNPPSSHSESERRGKMCAMCFKAVHLWIKQVAQHLWSGHGGFDRSVTCSKRLRDWRVAPISLSNWHRWIIRGICEKTKRGLIAARRASVVTLLRGIVGHDLRSSR